MLLSACATVPMASPEMDMQAKKMTPPPGKAVLYLYRDSDMHGSAVNLNVMLDGRPVGQLAPSTYMMWVANPGKHEIAATIGGIQGNNNVDVRPGESFYVAYKLGWTSLTLRLTSEEEGRTGVEKCNLAMHEGSESARQASSANENVQEAFRPVPVVTSNSANVSLLTIKPNNNADVGTKAVASGIDAYAEAKTLNTFDAYVAFLKAHPASEHRREALETMAGLIQKRNGTNADYKKFVSAYEDGLEFVPEKYRLALTGPDGMRVHDIVALRKKGVEDNLIGAKIRAGKGKYKDFSFEEMDALKKIGISAVLIEAMIDSTTRAKREEEELQKKQAMEDILAEIQRVQRKLAELKSVQPSAVTPVPVSTAGQSKGPSVTDTVQNCASQIAALEACKHLPSFGAMICKATAKSQFPCN